MVIFQWKPEFFIVVFHISHSDPCQLYPRSLVRIQNWYSFIAKSLKVPSQNHSKFSLIFSPQFETCFIPGSSTIWKIVKLFKLKYRNKFWWWSESWICDKIYIKDQTIFRSATGLRSNASDYSSRSLLHATELAQKRPVIATDLKS